jgi:hypothetical protein
VLGDLQRKNEIELPFQLNTTREIGGKKFVLVDFQLRFVNMVAVQSKYVGNTECLEY